MGTFLYPSFLRLPWSDRLTALGVLARLVFHVYTTNVLTLIFGCLLVFLCWRLLHASYDDVSVWCTPLAHLLVP